ncbi:MAG TPA: hypothetical protein VJ825_02680 [Gemmatimonadaceae bacterium]|nr:hypothetical protein [Gemmatimonadaceae bacterium]
MRTLRAILLAAALVACDRAQVRQSAPNTVASTTITIADTVRATDPVATHASSTSAVAPAVEDGSTRVPFSSPQDSLCGEVGENGLNIPTVARRAVAAQFGKPDSVRLQPGPNPYTPTQIDTVVNVFYQGIRLKYWVVGAGPPDEESLLEADITDNKYLKFPQVGIGATAEQIVAAIGEPADRTDDTYSYECGLHIMSGANVKFHFADGRVKRVNYRWEMD